jgi:hypothetical protein
LPISATSASFRLADTWCCTLFLSASLEILEEAQQVFGYGFARDLVEHGANVTADMGLQIGR